MFHWSPDCLTGFALLTNDGQTVDARVGPGFAVGIQGFSMGQVCGGPARGSRMWTGAAPHRMRAVERSGRQRRGAGPKDKDKDKDKELLAAPSSPPPPMVALSLGKGAHRALCARWAHAVREVGHLGPDGQGDRSDYLFPDRGPLGFLSSPKIQTMSESKLCFHTENAGSLSESALWPCGRSSPGGGRSREC